MATEILRPIATFGTTLPDDVVYDEEGEVTVWPGRNISEAIREALLLAGYVVSEPDHAPEHGWELQVSKNKVKYWIQVTRLADDECYLHTKFATWRLWGDRPGYRDFLIVLAEFLSSDEQFNNVAWHYPGGIDKSWPSSPSPLGQ